MTSSEITIQELKNALVSKEAEIERLKKAAGDLVSIENHRKMYGRDDHYKANLPLALQRADDAMKWYRG